MKIENCAAIVTGGASGLGAATARLLASQGAKVTIIDLNEDAGTKLAAEIGGIFVQVDVSSDENITTTLDHAAQQNGIARILVCCAGIGPAAKTVDRQGNALPLAQFRKMLEVNLVGTFNIASKFAAQAMRLDPIPEERGVIVMTASIAAFEGQIGQVAYAASKNGVVGMTLPLARELAPSGIRVVTIAPGLFRTPLLASLPEQAQRSLGQQIPFPSRLGDPAEYAQLVQAIITNPILNGETIRLDGAIRMPPR